MNYKLTQENKILRLYSKQSSQNERIKQIADGCDLRHDSDPILHVNTEGGYFITLNTEFGPGMYLDMYEKLIHELNSKQSEIYIHQFEGQDWLHIRIHNKTIRRNIAFNKPINYENVDYKDFFNSLTSGNFTLRMGIRGRNADDLPSVMAKRMTNHVGPFKPSRGWSSLTFSFSNINICNTFYLRIGARVRYVQNSRVILISIPSNKRLRKLAPYMELLRAISLPEKISHISISPDTFTLNKFTLYLLYKDSPIEIRFFLSINQRNKLEFDRVNSKFQAADFIRISCSIVHSSHDFRKHFQFEAED